MKRKVKGISRTVTSIQEELHQCNSEIAQAHEQLELAINIKNKSNRIITIVINRKNELRRTLTEKKIRTKSVKQIDQIIKVLKI